MVDTITGTVLEQDMKIRTGAQLKKFRLSLPSNLRSRERFAKNLIKPGTKLTYSYRQLQTVENKNLDLSSDLQEAIENFRKENK